MSKGGGTTSTIDSRLYDLLSKNYTSAQGLAAKPFTPYTGQLVASPSAATTQGQNALLTGALTAGQPTLNSAIAGAQNIANFNPAQVKAPTANAGMGQAATSGVYMPSPMGPAMRPMGVPPALSATAPTAAPLAEGQGLAFGRDARKQPRVYPKAVWSSNSPDAPLGSVSPASTLPSGPSIAAMQGLQGLDAYQNPYIDSVINAALGDLDRSRLLAVNQNASNAAVSDAFGGDRQAITDAETNRAFGDIAARTAAELRMGGFNTASGLLMSDKDRLLQNAQFNATNQQQTNLANMGAANQFKLANQALGLQAALANQGAGLQGAQVNLTASGQLGNLANQQQQQLLTGAGAVMGAGAQQDALAQAKLNAAYDQFQRQLAYPYEQQQLLNSALGMFGQANNTQTYTQPNYTAVSQNIGAVRQPTVICTALARRKLIDDKTLAQADGFGARHPVVVAGYRLWADPIARRMNEDAGFASFIAKLARPIIRKLAGGGPDLSPAGLILGCGIAVCWVLGLLRGFAERASIRVDA